MSNRISFAIANRRARENLVQILFGGSNASTSIPIDAASMAGDIDRHSHKNRRRRRNDDTSTNSTGTNVKRHTYSQLRSAYLDKVHSMHPDKLQHNQIQNKEDVHIQFIELKNAWEEYHASVRIVQRKSNDKSIQSLNNDNDDDDYWEEEGDDFTLFGVGCSFADSQAERDLRNKIMDQASRGWFSSGSISVANRDRDGDSKDESYDTKQHATTLSQLSDYDMFISTADQCTSEDSPTRRKCLVENVDMFRKKR